jgi:hypothetical protein
MVMLQKLIRMVILACLSHHEGLDQSMWDLWWTKWHWNKFFSELFGFPANIISPWLILHMGDEQ